MTFITVNLLASSIVMHESIQVFREGKSCHEGGQGEIPGTPTPPLSNEILMPMNGCVKTTHIIIKLYIIHIL